jgi:MinD-like ATPase involved in chromosome partitioning or flagellar assembly
VEHLQLKGRDEHEVVVALIHGHDVEGAPSRSDVEFAISHDVDHEIPFDRNVRKASQLGVPVVQHYPRTAASLAFGAMAGELAGFEYAPVEARDPIRGRFFSIFGSRKSEPVTATPDDVAV